MNYRHEKVCLASYGCDILSLESVRTETEVIDSNKDSSPFVFLGQTNLILHSRLLRVLLQQNG
jgi:hypothetical protein